MMTCNVMYTLLFAVLQLATAEKQEFSTRIVDGLGRPVQGVDVTVLSARMDADGTSHEVKLVELRSNNLGIARGSYDATAVPENQSLGIRLSKAGYKGYEQATLESEYVLRRLFEAADVARLTESGKEVPTQELREILAGEVEGEDLDKTLFVHGHSVRSGLRSLVEDPKIGIIALTYLAMLGEPDDSRYILQHAPAPGSEFAHAWESFVVTTVLEPATDEEWEFLKRCARGTEEDPWVQSNALQTLRVIASPKSRAILEELRSQAKDKGFDEFVTRAVAYIDTKPAPLSGPHLDELVKRVASAVSTSAKFQRSWPPLYSVRKDRVRVDFETAQFRDSMTYAATFHKVDGLWKLRTLHLFQQGTLIKPVD